MSSHLRRAWEQEEEVLSRVLGDGWKGLGGHLREVHSCQTARKARKQNGAISNHCLTLEAIRRGDSLVPD